VRRIVAIGSLLTALFAAATPAAAAQAPRARAAVSVTTRDLLALAPDPAAIAQATLGTVTASVYTIAASAVGDGTISPSGNRQVAPGSDQTFTMTPLPCALIDNVRVDGADLGPLGTYTFHGVSANHTIEARFVHAPPDTITASAGVGGSISPAGASVYDCGSQPTYTITPADESILNGDVLVDGASQGAVPSFTFQPLHASHTIAVRFVSGVKYTITATPGANGTITPSGDVKVGCGTDQTFSIAPKSCFKTADVVVDGVSQGPVTSYTFTNVRAAHTITASFVSAALTHTITASAGAGGSIEPAGEVVVDCGSNRTFTIHHDACYRVADVVVDGVSKGAVTSFVFTDVASSHTIAASFANSPQYTITATGGAGGTITPSGPTPVDCGSSQTFTIVPDSCCHVASVAVDGILVGAVTSYTFSNVNDSHSIAVLFSSEYDFEVFAVGCAPNGITPVVFGGLLLPNTTYSFDVQPLDCVPPAPGTVLAHAVSTDAGCFPRRRYSLIIDVVGIGVFVPVLDPVVCFELRAATAADGIQDLEGEITPEGPALSWWLMDVSRYRGFLVHRAVEGEGEVLVTSAPLAPPSSHPPAQMRWRDVTAVPGSQYAYRIEALSTQGSDWYGPVKLSIPALPHELALRAATPNPFHGSTRLVLDITSGERELRLDVFDVAGRHVRALRRGTMSPGQDVVDWDGLDDHGAPARGGLYMVRLQGSQRSSVLRVMKLD
jgi:hypothetical protein